MSNQVLLQREHYNQVAGLYTRSRLHPNHLAYKRGEWAELFRRMESLLQLSARGPVLGLEAMCGDAVSSLRVLERFPNVSMEAFDFSDEMVAQAARHGSDRLKVFHGDMTTFTAVEKYDFVLLVGGLHHLPGHVPKALANVVQALKPGGFFINHEATQNNIVWKKVRERIYRTNPAFQADSEEAFDLPAYNRLLAEAGLEVASQFYPGLLGYVLYGCPEAFPALNRGPAWLASACWKLDGLFGRTAAGRYLSFITWTFARKAGSSRA